MNMYMLYVKYHDYNKDHCKSLEDKLYKPIYSLDDVCITIKEVYKEFNNESIKSFNICKYMNTWNIDNDYRLSVEIDIPYDKINSSIKDIIDSKFKLLGYGI